MVEPEGGDLRRDGGKTAASQSSATRDVPAAPSSLPIHYGSLAVPETPPLPPPPTIAAETHYDVLGVSPKATRDQIDKAYKFCLDMYRDGALATYSLLEEGDAESARARIARAHEVLSDVETRRAYDASLGLTSEPAMVVPFEVTVRVDREGAPVAAAALETLVDSLSGADLRRIRESRGISLREIATASKVGLRFLEYIEEDRFALLPPPVYLRGFLQEYARALGIDPRRATDAYMSRLPPRQ